MKDFLLLNKWKFAHIESSEIKTIKEMIPSLKREDDLTNLSLKFRPFKVPGTLQSNLSTLEGFNPYFEKNIERFTSLENNCLILVHPLPKLDNSKVHYLEFDWIDTNADIFLDGKQVGFASNAFIKKKVTIPTSTSNWVPWNISLWDRQRTEFIIP